MTSPPRKTGSAEDGFTLVELMVVLIVGAVLMAIAYPVGSTARRAVDSHQASATAQSYSSAIESFMTDHAGAAPLEIGTVNPSTGVPDWPGPAGSSVAEQGPKSRVGVSCGGRASCGQYLKTIPEAVTDRRVGVGAAVSRRVWIDYRPYNAGGGGGPYFSFEVRALRRDGSYLCSFGTTPLPASAKPCSR